MNNNMDLLREYASLAGKEDEKSEARKTEILNYIKLNADDSFREEAEVFINQKIDQLQSEVQTLREQLAKEDYKLLPLRYIAQEYFGKSAAWLSQRLNGSEVRRQMDALKESDPKAFAVAVGYMAKTTEQQTKDSEIKQRIQDIQMLVSWREIAHTYFGKSASWLYHKLDGIDGNGGVGGFTEEEKVMLRGALCDVSNRLRAAADRI